MNRRNFLKSLGLAGAAAAVPGSAVAAESTSSASGRQQLTTLFDLSKCIGCGECVSACREINARKYPDPQKPFPKMIPPKVKVEDWSDKRDVEDRLTPYNWLYIQSATVQHNGQEHEVHVPRRCLHCQNPPCANLCPWGAAAKQADGAVEIDPDVCLGGAKCRSVCPWKIPQRQTGVGLYLKMLPNMAGNGVMFKCDRCKDNLQPGQSPACIEACPEEVQHIGPRDEIIKQAYALAKNMGGYVYGDAENGGTNTLYVSPVPFEKLNQAIEKGPGRPHLAPVEDAMKDENKLAQAVLLAPVAGLFAGVVRTAKALKTNKQHQEEGRHD